MTYGESNDLHDKTFFWSLSDSFDWVRSSSLSLASKDQCSSLLGVVSLWYLVPLQPGGYTGGYSLEGVCLYGNPLGLRPIYRCHSNRNLVSYLTFKRSEDRLARKQVIRGDMLHVEVLFLRRSAAYGELGYFEEILRFVVRQNATCSPESAVWGKRFAVSLCDSSLIRQCH